MTDHVRTLNADKINAPKQKATKKIDRNSRRTWKMKITYNICGLVIVAEDGGATLEGTLKETCPCCKKVDCTCHFSPDARSYNESAHKEKLNRELYNSIMDGLESLLIALAAEGVNIARPEFETAIQTAQESIANEY